jgi:hypothetical protein
VCVFITAGSMIKLCRGDSARIFFTVCVYYCRTYYKAVRGGEEESGRHVL